MPKSTRGARATDRPDPRHAGARTSRTSATRSTACSTARRSAGRCRSASPGRIATRCAASRAGRRESCAPTRTSSNVHDDWLEPVPTLKLDIDQDRARALGVTFADRAPHVAGRAVRRADRRVPRRRRDHHGDAARAVRHAQPAVGGGQRLREDGNRRLGAAARRSPSVNLALEPGIEWRRDRLPSITVRGVVPDNVQSPDVTNAIYAQLKPLRDALPARLSHRDAGRGRGIGHQPGLDQRQDADHAARHPAAADGAAAACRQDAAGAGDRPARADRRVGGAADVPGRRSASWPSSA